MVWMVWLGGLGPGGLDIRDPLMKGIVTSGGSLESQTTNLLGCPAGT